MYRASIFIFDDSPIIIIRKASKQNCDINFCSEQLDIHFCFLVFLSATHRGLLKLNEITN